MNFDLLDTPVIGTLILDADYKVAWANQTYGLYFGLPTSALTGQDQRQWLQRPLPFSLEESEQFTHHLLAAYADQSCIENFECHVLPSGASEDRWLSCFSQPIQSGPYAGGRIEYYTDITARKRAETAQRTSEEHLQAFLKYAPALAFIKDEDGHYVYLNPAIERFVNTPATELLGKTNADRLSPAIAQQLRDNDLQVLSSGQATEFIEILPVANGTLGQFLTVKFPLTDSDGSKLLAGVAIDITDRTPADAAREELLRRIVTTQEDERRRLARELHDELGQQLAALLLGLKVLPGYDQLPILTKDHLQNLQKITEQIMQRARRLAIDLRPETLDHLGLPEALQFYIREWSQRSGVPVDFHCNGLREIRLPAPIETTLYRVVQEALTNVLRHAQAKRVSVLLERRAGQVLTIVEDDGQGFERGEDYRLRHTERSLGLIGMQERVALVNGHLSIESSPGAGTTIFAKIPLNV